MPDTLPTRQRNALRILLEKSNFTPEDVAGLSYRRLLKSPGIGRKGMTIIRAWLAESFLDLADLPAERQTTKNHVESKRLQNAIHILESHGYEVTLRENRI
ncbi:MAG: hypothetical protein H6R07_497 [Proteobacteria bacterium]|nr:hypothetical protein [Pseudomonadota bacterium]